MIDIKICVLAALLEMIRISGISSEIMEVDVGGLTVWEIATKVKRNFGIPRREQKYYRGYTALSMSIYIQGPVELTMVRSPAICGGCGRTEKNRRYKMCSNCLDTCYCSHVCQTGHWGCHKMKCRGKKKQKVNHEHKYVKVFPNGPRDNNEYDLVCECGSVL